MRFANKLNFVAKLIISNRWCIVFIWYINPRTKRLKNKMRSRFDKVIDFESPTRQETKVWSIMYEPSFCIESLRHEIFYPCWGVRIFHRKSNHPKNIQSQLPKRFNESSLKSYSASELKLQRFSKLKKFQLDLIFSYLAL